MKSIFNTLIFLGLIVPLASFGMVNDEFTTKLNKIREAVVDTDEDEHSLESSLTFAGETTKEPTPRGFAQAIMDPDSFATNRAALNASRSTPKLTSHDNHDVHDNEWSDDDSNSPRTLAHTSTTPPIEPQPTISDHSDDENNNNNIENALPPVPLCAEQTRIAEQSKINAIAVAYANKPAPVLPRMSAHRPLPALHVPIQKDATPLPPSEIPVAIPDEEPIIEEIPEPIDSPPAVIPAQLITDLTEKVSPLSHGVKAEKRPASRAVPNHKTPGNRPAKKLSPRRLKNIPVQRTVKVTRPVVQPIKPKLVNPANIIISVGLFGIFTWLQENIFTPNVTKSRNYAYAQEITRGAQQAAAANIAQQILPGKSANSFAFTATFAMLHACEVGIKKHVAQLLNKTNKGKKIHAAFAKMSPRKRKILEHAGTATSCLFKTVLARAISA